jgi:hypothetical protein
MIIDEIKNLSEIPRIVCSIRMFNVASAMFIIRYSFRTALDSWA